MIIQNLRSGRENEILRPVSYTHLVRQFSHGDSSFLSDQYKPGIDL